ncbi:MAG TPA: superoxide dismutase family protein [Rhodocyclaceae bacterium]|nr:superoxide dismutase family protein [Rhodocyclaceae bacterium]
MTFFRQFAAALISSLVLAAGPATAAGVVATIYTVGVDGVIWDAGTVTLENTPNGLLLTPDLAGLPPGEHGFHVHEKPSCNAAEQDGKMVPALAAGGLYDPRGGNRHGAPSDNDHLGDLPPLVVLADGSVHTPVLAPRLKLEDVRQHSLVINAGSDNHAGQAEALGGGGARLLCGAVW